MGKLLNKAIEGAHCPREGRKGAGSWEGPWNVVLEEGGQRPDTSPGRVGVPSSTGSPGGAHSA